MLIKILLLAIFVHLGLLLTVSGASKISRRGTARLRAALTDDHLLPSPVCGIIAAALPPIELGNGMMLFAGFAPRATASMAALLLCGFFTYRCIRRLTRRTDKTRPCACFGELDTGSLENSSVAEDVGIALNLTLATAGGVLASGDFVYSTNMSVVLASSAVLLLAAISAFRTVQGRSSLRNGLSIQVSGREESAH